MAATILFIMLNFEAFLSVLIFKTLCHEYHSLPCPTVMSRLYEDNIILLLLTVGPEVIFPEVEVCIIIKHFHDQGLLVTSLQLASFSNTLS